MPWRFRHPRRGIGSADPDDPDRQKPAGAGSATGCAGRGFWQERLDFIRSQLEANRYILPTDLKLVRLVYSAEEAVDEINQFYANFHSTRWLKREFVVRMNHPLSERALAHMQQAFASLRLSGEFQQLAYTGAKTMTNRGSAI